MEHVYSSIDIGSDTIKIVVCELHKNHLNLLAASSSPAKGIKKGLIVEPNEARESIKKAFSEVEDMLGIKIKKVIASVPSYQADYKIIKGQTKVAGDIISSEDMINSYRKGIKSALKPDNEFISVIPIDFKINDKTIMKDPKDFPGDGIVVAAVLTGALLLGEQMTGWEKIGCAVMFAAVILAQISPVIKRKNDERGKQRKSKA